MLPYVDDVEIDTALAWISGRLDGLAYLHAMTATDDFSGDRVGFHRRSANRYVQLFASHGLRRVGPHLYAGPAVLATLTALEGPLEDPVDDTDVQ